jgi:hypothetical protein
LITYFAQEDLVVFLVDDEGFLVLVFTEDCFAMVFLVVVLLGLVFFGEDENFSGRLSILLMIVSNTLFKIKKKEK